MASNRELVEQYIDGLRRGDVDAAAAVFADDLQYHYHVGSKPIVGKERFVKMLRAVVPHQRNSKLRITALAETPTGVLYEAVDEHDDDSVGQHIVLPYVGSYDVRDGLIATARDYFDIGVYDAQKSGQPLPPWLRALADASA